MAGILIALVGQIALGLSLVIDKILLKTPAYSPRQSYRRSAGRQAGDETKNATTYTFWIGILSIFGLTLLPFGFYIPSFHIILVSLGTGVIFFFGLLSYYKVLEESEASRALTAVGGLSPIAAGLGAIFLLATPLNIAEQIAFGFLVAGSLIVALTEKGALRRTLPWIVLAAAFFGLADVLEKVIFNQASFATGYIFMKAGTLIATLALLLFPHIRRTIFEQSGGTVKTHRMIYFGNRLLSGSASFLLFYAIKFEHPALVEATNGMRYAAIFLITLLVTLFKPAWLKERFRGWALAGKVVATILILIGLAGLSLERYYEAVPIPSAENVTWGVTYSELMAKHLNLDWQVAYLAILNDLHPRSVRLVAAWDALEPQKGTWDFSDLDWQVTQAEEKHIPYIIVMGQKTPRWPECHIPDWVMGQETSVKQDELLNYIQTVVGRYKNNQNLLYWQVENEPFLNFGECLSPDSKLVDREMSAVKTQDPQHQTLTTDGGEFGDWVRAASRSDVFGTTLYRKVYNRYFGLMTYPLTPALYPLRKDMTRWITGKPNQKFIVIELGLEPWTKKQIYEISDEQQLSLFNINDFHDNIAYARATGFDTFYLWGAEWWYHMKSHGHPEFWEAAQAIIKESNN